MSSAKKKVPRHVDRPTLDQVQDFYKHGYVQHATGAARRGERMTTEKAQLLANKKTDQVYSRTNTRDMLQQQNARLWRAFVDRLRELTEKHGLKYDDAMRIFKAEPGCTSTHYTLQREFLYREDIKSKQKARRGGSTPSISEDDPLLPRLTKGFEVPACEFVCSDDVRQGRPQQPFGYTTKKSKEGKQLIMGRVSETNEEKYMRQKAVAEAKRLGLPPPAPMSPRDWLPVDPKLMEKLRPAVAAFEAYLEHDFRVFKPARDQLNTINRPFKEALGKCHTRGPDPPRPRAKSPKTKPSIFDTPHANLRFNLSETCIGGDARRNGEFENVAHIWRLLGISAFEGQYRASMDRVMSIIDQFGDTNAMVFRCDFAYEAPDGRHFRNCDERVSYTDADLAQLASKPGFGDASNGRNAVDDANDGAYSRTYHIDGLDYTLRPYAAVFDSASATLDLHIPTLFRYYPELYADVKCLLDEWYAAFESDNGGYSAERAQLRSKLEDDIVFGPGVGWVLTESPPRPLGSPYGRWPSYTKMRVRRRRRGELLEEGGSLPDTGYPLVCEYDVGIGWMLWTDEKFMMQDAHGVWRVMPEDANGKLRPLGWMDGDDAAAEEHDYACVDMRQDMMPQTEPLLPPMFG